MIDALFPGEYFKVEFSTDNGTYHVVRTLRKGDTDLEGALSTIKKQVIFTFTKHQDYLYLYVSNSR
jgi:hypothetical protein